MFDLSDLPLFNANGIIIARRQQDWVQEPTSHDGSYSYDYDSGPAYQVQGGDSQWEISGEKEGAVSQSTQASVGSQFPLLKYT